MEKIKNRYILIILLIAITAILTNLLSYNIFNNKEVGANAIQHIPIDLGKWHGTDLDLQESIYEILETRSIIHRSYKSGERSVFLSVVYYPETKVDFHAPEGCLAGRGIQIDKSKKIIEISNKNKTIDIGMNQLLRKNDNYNELVYYFYKAGDFMGENYIKLRWSLAVNKFGNNKKSGALIRLTTPINDKGIQESSDVLKEFIEELYPYLIEYL
jgi:EpsI family protein